MAPGWKSLRLGKARHGATWAGMSRHLGVSQWKSRWQMGFPGSPLVCRSWHVDVRNLLPVAA